MDSKLRKLVIGFISLAVVLVIYLFYSRTSKTPPIDTDVGAGFIDTVADSNVGGLDSEKVGMLGDVGVGTVRKSYYFFLNKDQEVERELGFEELLHKVRDIWEIEKPYMNVYRRNFRCYITADKGSVQFETAVGRSTPKDATFTDNVVIHILPEGSSEIEESYIYLDDIIFQSEKSQLSTSGPVKYVSENAQMLGTGMELVYDDQLERLEYLRILDLESLRIKSSQTGFLPGSKRPADGPAVTGGQARTQQPDEPAMASDKQEVQPTAARPEVEQRKASPERSRRGEYYKCVFSKNVLIDSPEQLVFADEKVCINDIFWEKSSSGRPDKVDVDSGPAEQGRQNAVQTNANNINVTAAKPNEPNEPTEKFEDIVVTCDSGFVVVPKDSPRALENPAHGLTPTKRPTRTNTDVSVRQCPRQYPSVFDQAKERTTFIARRVDYNAATGDTVVTGESELEFYTSDAVQTDPNQPAIPVKIISQEQVRFLQALNRAIFEGDCVCTMRREDPNFQQQYTLLAPKLTIDLPKDKKAKSSTTGIEHLRADGGLVRLATVKTAKEKLLSGVEIKCYQVDYDPGRALFVAAGPGVIKLNNSSIPEPNEQGGRFSLRKPCWASVENFDTLKYFSEANRIIADAKPQDVLIIGYVPIVKDGYGQAVKITAAHIEALLTETAEGQTELLSLTASGGITYKDQDKEFDGSKLFYDADKLLVTVQGDEFQPCYFNGNPVDEIEWDLKSDTVKFEISGPGTLQLNR